MGFRILNGSERGDEISRRCHDRQVQLGIAAPFDPDLPIIQKTPENALFDIGALDTVQRHLVDIGRDEAAFHDDALARDGELGGHDFDQDPHENHDTDNENAEKDERAPGRYIFHPVKAPAMDDFLLA